MSILRRDDFEKGARLQALRQGRRAAHDLKEKSQTTQSRLTEDLNYAPEGTRTPNLRIRSAMLYPIELRAPAF